MKINCIECGESLPLTSEHFQKNYNYKHGFRTVCKSCLSRRKKKAYQENREEKRKKDNEWRSRNKNKIKGWGANWREKNREEINEKKRAYYKTENGRAKLSISTQKRMAIKRSLPATFTEKEWEMCKEAFSDCCAYCGKNEKLEQDHFIPLSKGGGYVQENILPACKSCNLSKYNLPFNEWYPKHAAYSNEREHRIYSYLEYVYNKGVEHNG